MEFVLMMVILAWATSAIVRKADLKRQAKWKAEIEAEQRKRRQQQLEEQRRIKELARAQEKEIRERIRLTKEVEKHEAWLKKHDDEIAKLQFRLDQACEDIGFLRDKITRLNKLAAFEENERDKSTPTSAEYQKHERKVLAIENQIRTAHRQLEKAYNTRSEAERKLGEVA